MKSSRSKSNLASSGDKRPSAAKPRSYSKPDLKKGPRLGDVTAESKASLPQKPN